MKAPPSRLILIILAAILAVSCGEKPPAKKEAKEKEGNFYEGVEPTLTVDSLKNELKKGETDFLRSFAQDQIPWQLWDDKILEKSTKAQLPVLVFVGSPLGSASRHVAEGINQNPTLRETLSTQTISTVVDTRIDPEIGILSFFLSNEINRSTAFPMLIWLSPEGSPLAWIPVGPTEGRELEKVITSASAMVNDIWTNSSRYAVENSRRDNEARQLRFNYEAPSSELAVETGRDTIFQKSTRQLSSLYAPSEGDLDNIGGLLPTSSLELLSIGSRSKLLTDEVRSRCQAAVRGVTGQLMHGAMRDPLDQLYFYARKANDWSLPSFSKDLESQARVASLLLKAGALVDEPEFTTEGLRLLRQIEKGWLKESITVVSSHPDRESPETFLWSFDSLKKVLTKEELPLAIKAFSLEESGNIPLDVDPLGKYYRLNSLRNQTTIAELATVSGETEDVVTQKLDQIRDKMLQHRLLKGELIFEKTITLKDLNMVLQAQIARLAQTGKDSDLEACLKTADRITRDYWDPAIGLTRHPGGPANTPACGRDYAATSLLLTLLSQHQLDSKWLSLATAIMDKALADLSQEDGLLAELKTEDRIIPIRQHNFSMIFGTSTLGFADQAANRLFALTRNPAYKKLLDRHFEVIATRVDQSVVNHTDFLISCALGDEPLLAVLQGSADSPAAREHLAILNSPTNVPFLSIRPAETTGPLAPLPDLPAPRGEASVVLLLGHQILGQAASAAELTILLDSVISSRE